MQLLYVTFASKEEAVYVADELIKRQLIRCANILPEMLSVYEWEEKVQKETEVIGIFKTSDAKLELAIKHIEALHSYECPCIMALPIKQGNSAFLEWVEGV